MALFFVSDSMAGVAPISGQVPVLCHVALFGERAPASLGCADLFPAPSRTMLES